MDMEKLQGIRNKSVKFVKGHISIFIEITLYSGILKYTLDKAGFEYMFIAFAVMVLLRLGRI